MVQEAYCSYEVSKLLKEKGFDEPTHRYYVNGNLMWSSSPWLEIKFNSFYPDRISAPTHQMVLAWLREKGIYIMIDKDFTNTDGWHYYIATKEAWNSSEIGHIQQESNHYSYEEAVEAALKYSLENLI